MADLRSGLCVAADAKITQINFKNRAGKGLGMNVKACLILYSRLDVTQSCSGGQTVALVVAADGHWTLLHF